MSIQIINHLMIKKSKDHLSSVNENYFEHMLVALKVSFKMLYGGLLALVHGLIPGVFQTGASNKIKELYEFINKKR